MPCSAGSTSTTGAWSMQPSPEPRTSSGERKSLRKSCPSLRSLCSGLRKSGDWPGRLVAYIDMQAPVAPFEWGTNDCMTFIAGGIEAMSGVDIMDGARGAYASAVGATRELLARACRDIAAYLGSAFEEVPPSM